MTSSFSLASEKTMSYKQLKSDYSSILKEHGELQNKLNKQQTYLNKAKTTKKKLEKENQELKEQLDANEAQHKESIAELSESLNISNSKLQKKMDEYERELERLGVDPVTLKPLQGDNTEDNEELKKATVEHVKELLKKLNRNMESSEAMFVELQDIRDQCKTLLNENALQDSEGT